MASDFSGSGAELPQDAKVLLPALDCTDSSANLLLKLLPLARRSEQAYTPLIPTVDSAIGLDVIAP